VRPVQGADFRFIADLGASAFAEFGYASGAARVWMAEHFCTWVAVSSGSRLDVKRTVAEPNRLGFAVLAPPQADRAEISAIAVARGERGRGIGRLLLDATEATAWTRGARQIIAHTADANLAALQLFLSRGYQIRRRLPGYYGVYAACELVLLRAGVS
jgi:ribosomal protein S18 acetylase RimI-like enzyme